MANITNVVQVGASVYRVSVTVTSVTTISDPVAYVSQAAVSQEILSRAGLPSTLLFIAAALTAIRTIGSTKEYALTCTFDSTAVTASGHSHDYNTLLFPLRESYRDGPTIDLDPLLGPVIISYTDGSTDFFRIKKDTDDLFYVKADGDTRFGGNLEVFPDGTFDIGTPDEGSLLRRPRDIRLSRNMYIGGDIDSEGSANFYEGVEAQFFAFTPQTSNPDTAPGDRIIYWNSIDNNLHSWDGTVDSVIGGSAAPATGQFTCPLRVQVQDAVTLIAAGQVDQADASSSARVLGFVVSKSSGTDCVVQLSGEMESFPGTLIPNSQYYLSLVPGQITANLGTLTPGSWSHTLGISKDANTLVTRFEIPTQI